MQFFLVFFLEIQQNHILTHPLRVASPLSPLPAQGHRSSSLNGRQILWFHTFLQTKRLSLSFAFVILQHRCWVCACVSFGVNMGELQSSGVLGYYFIKNFQNCMKSRKKLVAGGGGAGGAPRSATAPVWHTCITKLKYWYIKILSNTTKLWYKLKTEKFKSNSYFSDAFWLLPTVLWVPFYGAEVHKIGASETRINPCVHF